MELSTNRVYMSSSVLEEARRRVSLVFDHFETVAVSVSSGKDSTVLYWLAVQEAERRSRKVIVFFLDQEAEFESSIDLIEEMMSHPAVIPQWYQVPLNLTNVTSYGQAMFCAWGEGQQWIRQKHKLSIHSIGEDYPQRFYSFFRWRESRSHDTAFLVGLRAEESLNRLRAVAGNAGWGDVAWSTKTSGKNTYRFYPLYDWTVSDVWLFIHEHRVSYNAVYDQMFRANKSFYKTMRVSNLIHEKSFKCLSDLQIYEPETFNKLVERVPGIHIAALYADENSVFESNRLPEAFGSWLEFRDYLLKTSPVSHRELFLSRFRKQRGNEETYRRQARQVMLNDYENNLKVSGQKARNREDLKVWWDLL